MMKSEYERDGCYLVKAALSASEVSSLVDATAQFGDEANNYGVRNLMQQVPVVRELAFTEPLLSIAREILGEVARPVRSVFFDKVPGANWNVPWHQDTSIVLQARHDVPGFGPWSEKQGIVHAEPPEAYLANMLTLRLHLDPANRESGVLRVVPSTHREGRIPSQEIMQIVARSDVLECNAEPGDLLLMSPLLFHSSRKAISPTHRRIIHIEYAVMTLPPPLQWFES
ncbi:MAG: phytanoyl-CoA dioxygenase [Zetaproteobacteria bacterium CG_4_9_14_3_um_filter_49_83]|nr:MAG: phytanoyl-CoA dioxygenase [Zetaproteobacteria bacterium CG17_big_fil_post_rev_8_21_14_2_50_50_13]PIV29574.1 MAG: phytanoyl-CoA dioxygenase [Zetaproteobacteria bacterium CG02_land_8_20_14_3_00_50_9]PIY56507.1 MAG: phytanoyl-CoA dioxygenase [Zetaproteobacteria bacterium CG_4_10_14_0_8_um_filter_49_80]PJA33855.1 MAG: phytanoyl-CoA dioxygenase [Zetaproteobacteria bacterium CG_4_9_14_3_um_filter_49_83]